MRNKLCVMIVKIIKKGEYIKNSKFSFSSILFAFVILLFSLYRLCNQLSYRRSLDQRPWC